MSRKRTINNIGKNIKVLRLQNNISQQELASVINKSQTYISRIENGAKLDAEYLKPIAIKLGLKDPFKLIEKSFFIGVTVID